VGTSSRWMGEGALAYGHQRQIPAALLPRRGEDPEVAHPARLIGRLPRSGIEPVTASLHEAANRPLASRGADGRPTPAARATSKLPTTISPGPKAAG